MRSSPLSYLLQRLLLFILCIRSMTGRGFVWQLMDSASDPSLSAEALMKESMPNFVQPVRTNDRTYFIFTSMRQILAVAHKTKAFRVVEPFLKDNRLSDSGIRSSVFISYEAYASSKYPDYIAFDDWQSTQGPGKGLVVDIEVSSTQLAYHTIPYLIASHRFIDRACSRQIFSQLQVRRQMGLLCETKYDQRRQGSTFTVPHTTALRLISRGPWKLGEYFQVHSQSLVDRIPWLLQFVCGAHP